MLITIFREQLLLLHDNTAMWQMVFFVRIIANLNRTRSLSWSIEPILGFTIYNSDLLWLLSQSFSTDSASSCSLVSRMYCLCNSGSSSLISRQNYFLALTPTLRPWSGLRNALARYNNSAAEIISTAERTAVSEDKETSWVVALGVSADATSVIVSVRDEIPSPWADDSTA